MNVTDTLTQVIFHKISSFESRFLAGKFETIVDTV